MVDGTAHSFRIFLLLLLLFLLFVWVSQRPELRQFDLAALQTIQKPSSTFLDYGFFPFVMVGSIEISVFGLLLLSIWLYRRKEVEKAYLILAALLILTGIEFGMKSMMYHPKVPLEYQGRFPCIPLIGSAEIRTMYSFPSGHALRSMLLFGALYLWFGVGRYKKVFLWFVLIYSVLQVFGMNYYGFHWTNDLLGGYYLAFLGLYFINRCLKHELPRSAESDSPILKK